MLRYPQDNAEEVLTTSNAVDQLQAARQRAGMTLEAIAEEVHRDTSTVSRWLRGKQQMDFEELESLARAMKQTITLTFGTKRTKKEPPPAWAKALPKDVADAVIARLSSPVDLDATMHGLERLEALQRQPSEQRDTETGSPARGE